MPDYIYGAFNFPLIAGGHLQFSKDWHLYGSFNLLGITGGNYEATKNWKLGVQGGAAYFVTTEMGPQQRDRTIQGVSINVTTGPIGGTFQLQGGTSAITIGGPISLGVNISGSKQIF